ncbi:MAG: osmotically-inducible protein OsmY [Granulosicoccus sp.]|jgi:osmotically-inducible protein OsmY
MINNSQLRKDVIAALSDHQSVDTTHVVITADSGTITLAGHVSAYPDIFSIRQAVGHVLGVRAIADELRLRLPDGHMRVDSDIAHDIVLALECSAKHSDSDILAEVSGGLVTLSGTVDWHHERQGIEQRIQLIRGVFNI